jgi:hypothetical protein
MKKNLGPSFGFLAALVLLAGTMAFSAAPLKLKVTAELANIRLKPSISSVIIRQIAQGEILEAVRQEGEWYLVKIEPDEGGNTAGYVHESLVLPLEETPRTERRAQVVEPPAKKETEPARKVEPVVQKAPARESGEASASSWSFTISAGGNASLGGDLNKGAKGLADYIGAQLGAAADTTVSAANLSYMFGGEAAIYFSSRFQLTIGADFFSSSKNSLITYDQGVSSPTFAAKPRFQAVPVSLGLKIYTAGSFFLRLGVAFYFANGGYHYRYENDNFWQEWNGDANAQGFGAFGGVGYDWAVSENISLVFEALGHYAPIKSFRGTGDRKSTRLNSSH